MIFSYQYTIVIQYYGLYVVDEQVDIIVIRYIDGDEDTMNLNQSTPF